MTPNERVTVRQFPHFLTPELSEAFFRGLMPVLENDRPYLVFDLSEVYQLNSLGVTVLLRCMEEVIKRNGDLKLVAPSPQLAAILELTRISDLFETFENCSDAVESFFLFSDRDLWMGTAVPDSSSKTDWNRIERPI